MRNVMKAATLESKFPILSVEHDCIISKDADITVCYRVESYRLPSLRLRNVIFFQSLEYALNECFQLPLQEN